MNPSIDIFIPFEIMLSSIEPFIVNNCVLNIIEDMNNKNLIENKAIYMRGKSDQALE
jgi:hypothetical protein